MRHEPIDPAWSPGRERAIVVTTESPMRAFGPRLDALERTALATIAAGVLSDVEARERRQLEEIAAARARLAHGTFGTCEACGGTIPLSRLEALPTARYCLVCQRKTEQTEAEAVSRRGA